MAEAGLRALWTIVFFVNLHSEWRMTPYGALLCGYHLRRNIQWLISQQECSCTAHFTPGFRNRSVGFCTNIWGTDPAPNRAMTSTEQRGGSAQPPVQAPVTPPQKQHTLRKDMVGIYTKDSLAPKNIRVTQPTQGCSHIKIALQDHSR